MNNPIGKELCLAVEQAIKKINDAGSSWKDMPNNGVQCIVECGHCYSIKSQFSLRACALGFSPLHSTFFSYTEPLQRDHIGECRTVEGESPVQFDRENQTDV